MSEESSAEEELRAFGQLIRENTILKFKDQEEASRILSKAWEKIKELRESRDLWKTKYNMISTGHGSA